MSSSILRDEYKEAYTSIVMYLSSSGMQSNFMDEVSEDIKDLLISAQDDGIAVKSIVGNNIEEFCKEIIKSKDIKGRILFNIFESIKWALIMSAMISLVYYLFGMNFTLNIIFMFIVDFLFCRFIFSIGLRKVIIKNRGNAKKIIMTLLLYILFIIPGAILNFILITNFAVEINSLYTSIGLITILLLSYITNKTYRNRKIRLD
jgi:DNA-binding ferritin-like protein (Dps family)